MVEMERSQLRVDKIVSKEATRGILFLCIRVGIEYPVDKIISRRIYKQTERNCILKGHALMIQMIMMI